MLSWIKEFFVVSDNFEEPEAQVTPTYSFTRRYTVIGVIFGLAFPMLAVIILLWINKDLPFSANVLNLFTEPLLWIICTAPVFLGFFASLAGQRQDRLWEAYGQLQQNKQQLQELTEQLQWRKSQLIISSEVSSRLSTILNVDELLTKVVHQVKEIFNYYHVHIYLLDERKGQLVMAEGTGRAGAEMKLQKHHIELNAPGSLVARAARSGDVVLVENVQNEPDWLPHPLLPDTCSEIAVPVILEGKVVGVLDVQEDKVAGLEEGDADLLRSLANQIAVAMRNARIFTEAEAALAEAREVQEKYFEKSWRKVTVASGETKYLYARPNAALPDATRETILTKMQQQTMEQHNRPVVVSTGDEMEGTSVVVPIHSRNKTIGALQLYTAEGDHHRWNEDDLALIETVVDQLAQTAETLRLFEETREQVGREEAIREVTDKLRSTTNLDSLLETAARELAQRLGVRHTVLEMGIDSDVQDDGVVNRSNNQ